MIESKRNPRRADWLREKGLKTKPLHTFRKEFGSLVCDRHGIYAASRALRHASVVVTAANTWIRQAKSLPD